MKKSTYIYAVLALSLSVCTFSCTTNDVDEFIPTGEVIQIEDNAFGEYLFYLKATGVTEVKETVGGQDVYKYFINTDLAKNQTDPLNMSKATSAITTLKSAGVRTAEDKIKKMDELKYFVNVTGLTFTSNEIEAIDITELTKLETLNLNNNWIASLDLTKNVNLVTLSYNASSKVDDTKKMTTIDLSKNVSLKSVILNGHPGTDFPIPESIYNQLTTKEGVKPDTNVTPSKIQFVDEAFGEYLKYLDVAGVTEVKETIGGTDVYKYFIDPELAKNQVGALSMSKTASVITTLTTAGVRTAGIKIKNIGELEYFINVTGLTFTSNEVEDIDLSKLTKLESLNLNNNFIGSLDLTKNVELTTLSYTPSSKATASQKLTTIDLSKNTKLTSVDLTGHTGAPFKIPATIFNQLTTAKGVEADVVNTKILIQDEAFGEYLKYLKVVGVTEEKENIGETDVYKYYVDIELAKNQSDPLNMSKASTAITTLANAGVRTAVTKIKNVTELQYFINITNLTLTSNEVESIDITKLTKLEVLNLNNNFIGSIDISKNTELTILSYTASSKATATQKLTTIDLSKNTKLTSVDLSNHTGAPFTIPAAIFGQLTTAKGVKSE